MLAPVFLGLAALMYYGPDNLNIPELEPVVVADSQLSIAPRRQTITDPPVITIDGFQRTCNDCHKMFPPRTDPPKKLLRHQNVVLNHGINKRCRNCHDESNRNLLVLRGGETVTYDHVVELCAKCHGPKFRDWQRGAHGRTNGYWDASRGVVRRLTCCECHNPHSPRVPAMDPLRPLPGPRTLRMPRTSSSEWDVHESGHGDHAHEQPVRDPLQRALLPGAERPQDADTHAADVKGESAETEEGGQRHE